MNHHILIPNVQLRPGFLAPLHETYLRRWREEVIQRADAGDIAASECLQATFIDLLLYGKPRHDWLSIMEEHLTENGEPLAYSLAYGKRLHKFDAQYRQSTIHAIHTRWWIEKVSAAPSFDQLRFADLVLAKKQSDGLFYDRDVSETILRHRMKSELTLSTAMAAEILFAAGRLSAADALRLATDISSPTKCPALGYMSMEYFRLAALRLLHHEELFPIGLAVHITACTEGLPIGWCDFSIRSKIDAYMGTAKRTQRDKPIHSPLIACHVAELSQKVTNTVDRDAILHRLGEYCLHLKAHPTDIPAFQMRDVPIPFGADITPLEAICASHLISQCRTT